MKTTRLVLVASLLLNLVGSSLYVRQRLKASAATSPAPTRWQETLTYKGRMSLIAANLRAHPSSTVYLGDSLTAWANLPDGVNAGIEGDEISDIRARIDSIITSQPSRIFLMIGANDATRGHSIEAMTADYRALVSDIRSALPATTLILQSILPVTPRLLGYATDAPGKILAVNREIAEIAKESGAVFLDLYPAFALPDGTLNGAFTLDGIHLNANGCRHWRESLK
jgi:lysophospholipase L1-like esterase